MGTMRWCSILDICIKFGARKRIVVGAILLTTVAVTISILAVYLNMLTITSGDVDAMNIEGDHESFRPHFKAGELEKVARIMLTRRLVGKDWPHVIPAGYQVSKEQVGDDFGISRGALISTENMKSAAREIKGHHGGTVALMKHEFGCEADEGNVAPGFKSGQEWLQFKNHVLDKSCRAAESSNGVNMLIQLPKIDEQAALFASDLQKPQNRAVGWANWKKKGSEFQVAKDELTKAIRMLMEKLEDQVADQVNSDKFLKQPELQELGRAFQIWEGYREQNVSSPLPFLFSLEHTASVMGAAAATATGNSTVDSLPPDFSVPNFLLNKLVNMLEGPCPEDETRSRFDCRRFVLQSGSFFSTHYHLIFQMDPKMISLAQTIAEILQKPMEFCFVDFPSWARFELCTDQTGFTNIIGASSFSMLCDQMSAKTAFAESEFSFQSCTKVKVDMANWLRPIPLHVLVNTIDYHIIGKHDVSDQTWPPPAVGYLQHNSLLSAHDPLFVDILWPKLSIFLRGRASHRAQEYLETLQSNICNPSVHSIVVFQGAPGETDFDLRSLNDPCNKLTLVQHEGRLSYADFMKEANRRFEGKWVVIGNADIVLGYKFDPHKVAQRLSSTYQLSNISKVALIPSRHEFIVPGKNSPWSGVQNCCSVGKFWNCHDLFVFQPPMPQKAIDRLNFVANTWNAESVVMYELFEAGFLLANPCMSPYAANFHNHFTQSRTSQSNLELCLERNCASFCAPTEDLVACEPVLQDFLTASYPRVKLADCLSLSDGLRGNLFQGSSDQSLVDLFDCLKLPGQGGVFYDVAFAKSRLRQEKFGQAMTKHVGFDARASLNASTH